MKQTLLTILCLLVALIILQNSAFAQSSVTFRVDIENYIKEGKFDPETDRVELFGDIMPLRNTRAVVMEPEDEEGSYIYTATVQFRSFDEGKTLNFRYRLVTERRIYNEDDILPRSLTIRAGVMNLGADWFNLMAF